MTEPVQQTTELTDAIKESRMLAAQMTEQHIRLDMVLDRLEAILPRRNYGLPPERGASKRAPTERL